MNKCKIQLFKVGIKQVFLVLCILSVFAAFSCASSSSSTATLNYEMAKVYLTSQGPTPGNSGDFWSGLTGTFVNRHPWAGGPSDANGHFYLAADSSNLYVRAEIKDSAPQTRPVDMEASSAWNGTSLQLFFGTKLNRRTEYEDGDFGLAFWVVQEDRNNPDSLKVIVAKGRILNERQYKAAVVEWNRDSYIIEASFPFSVLGINKSLKVNQKIRCEFRINHAKMGDDRSVIVNWRTSTDDAWRNPTTWSLGVIERKP